MSRAFSSKALRAFLAIDYSCPKLLTRAAERLGAERPARGVPTSTSASVPGRSSVLLASPTSQHVDEKPLTGKHSERKPLVSMDLAGGDVQQPTKTVVLRPRRSKFLPGH